MLCNLPTCVACRSVPCINLYHSLKKPNKCWVLAFPAVMQESPPPLSPALPPSIMPVSEVMQCGAGLLPQARSCIHALGCRMSQERRKQHPEVCVPSCCQSAQPHSAWGQCLGFFGQWGTARNRKASALCQECLLHTLHACNTGVKLPTQVTHAHGSSVPAEVPGQPPCSSTAL